MTQAEIILKISKRKWISPLDALQAGAGMKLATRVGELRKAGYLIESKWHPSKKYKLYKYHGKATI
jgi:hypothetical protein